MPKKMMKKKKMMMPEKEMGSMMAGKPMMGSPMMTAMKRDGFKTPSPGKAPPFGKKKKKKGK